MSEPQERYLDRKRGVSPLFQERLDGFERRNPTFIEQFGTYEVTVCEQAEAIAAALQIPEDMEWWWALPRESQLDLTLGLDPEITQFALQEAANLAYALLAYPEMIPKLHGALCNLVGCRSYGCFAVEQPFEVDGTVIG